MEDDESKKTLEYKYFNDDSEWNLSAFKIDLMELTDDNLNTTYSAIKVKLAFERMPTYYVLTLIIPILALTFLSPVGLILPGQNSQCKTQRLT